MNVHWKCLAAPMSEMKHLPDPLDFFPYMGGTADLRAKAARASVCAAHMEILPKGYTCRTPGESRSVVDQSFTLPFLKHVVVRFTGLDPLPAPCH